MSSTITLLNTINAVQPLVKYRPLAFPSLSTPIYEPAITMANKILLTILGPPFGWRWNRNPTQITFTCVANQTDYPVTVSNYGWIETAAAKDISANAIVQNQWKQMSRLEGLALATEIGLPANIAPQYDNGAGQITFRVMPAPDQAYPIAMDIQQKPTMFSNTIGAPLNQTWAPIPDEYSHIYTWGFETLALLLADDPKWSSSNQKFVSTLLATHQGLDANQKNLFLATWQQTIGAPIFLMDKMQQGVQARAT